MRPGSSRLSILKSALIAAALTLPTAAMAEHEFDPEKPYKLVDGKVDFGTYNGFRRYHSDCHVCHGPAGLGSSYAPALLESLKYMSYGDFANTVAAGRVGSDTSVMPAFASNPDVMLYMQDIYAYLKARSDGVIGRNRPPRLPKEKH